MKKILKQLGMLMVTGLSVVSLLMLSACRSDPTPGSAMIIPADSNPMKHQGYSSAHSAARPASAQAYPY